MTTTNTNKYPMFRRMENGNTVSRKFQYATTDSVLNPGKPNWTTSGYSLSYAKKLAKEEMKGSR